MRYQSPASAYQYLNYELSGIYDEREAKTILGYFFIDFFSISQPELTDEWASSSDALKCESLGNRLINKEPYQYLTEKTNFFGYDFKVNQSVLIPRAETEELVYLVLSDLVGSRKQLDVLDIGAGSGCISISLKLKKPQLRVFAVESSLDALNVSRINSKRLDASVQFFRFDFTDEEMWSSLCKMDIIVSNPPYITVSEKERMSASTLQYEPQEALFVEEDSMLFYKKIAAFGLEYLKDEGTIYVEINEFRADETMAVFKEIGYESVELHYDMQKRARMLRVRR